MKKKLLIGYAFLLIVTITLLLVYIYIYNNANINNYEKSSINVIKCEYDTYMFGEVIYESEDKKIKEPIEWLIIDNKEDKMLLLSKKILYSHPMYKKDENNYEWSNSQVRLTLNGEVYNRYFGKEKNRIIKTLIVNDKNNKYGLNAGENTEDYLFVLSNSEYEKYMGGKDDIEISELASLSKSYNSFWSRTAGCDKGDVAYISSDGIYDKGCCGSFLNMGVRPAMWVKK